MFNVRLNIIIITCSLFVLRVCYTYVIYYLNNYQFIKSLSMLRRRKKKLVKRNEFINIIDLQFKNSQCYHKIFVYLNIYIYNNNIYIVIDSFTVRLNIIKYVLTTYFRYLSANYLIFFRL